MEAAHAGESPPSGSYLNNLGKLRSAGLVDYPGGRLQAAIDRLLYPALHRGRHVPGAGLVGLLGGEGRGMEGLTAAGSMEHYERILPGLANRIVTMAEQAQASSLAMEKTQGDAIAKVTRAGPYLKTAGLACAFILYLLLFCGTYKLLMADKKIAGSLGGLAAVVYSIVLFVSQRRKPKLTPDSLNPPIG